MATLEIAITSLTPATYEKTSGSGDVTAQGNIDVTGVDEAVDLVWTIDDGVDRTFRPNPPPPPGPIIIVDRDGGGPPDGLFGQGVLSAGNKTLTVADVNTEGSNAAAGPFVYTLHFTDGAADPSIRNR